MESHHYEESFQLNTNGEKPAGVLKLSGQLLIQDAVALKETLIKALSQADVCHIDLEHVSQYDLSSIQLLYAAYKSAFTSEKTLKLIGECPLAFRKAVSEVGFDNIDWFCFGKS